MVVNVIVQSVSALQAVNSVAQGGKIVIPGYAGGIETTPGIVDVVFKEIQIIGLNLLTRPPELIAQAKNSMLQLAAEGKVKPVVNKTFPLAEAAAAQCYLMETRPFGRVVPMM